MIVNLTEEEVAFAHWMANNGGVAPDDADLNTVWRKRFKSTIADDKFGPWTGETTKDELAFLSRAMGETKRFPGMLSEGFSKLRANVKVWMEAIKAEGK